MKESIEKLLENREIKPTSGRILIFKAMKEFDSAFSLGDLENKIFLHFLFGIPCNLQL